MMNLYTSRYHELKFPLKLKCALLLLLLNGACRNIQISECTSSADPVVLEEGSHIDKILTNLGLKNTLVTNVGENPEDKTFIGEDANGVPIVVGTWFTYGSFTLGMAIFGTAFLLAAAFTAVYYVLFVVTIPEQLVRKKRDATHAANNSYVRIVKAIRLAYETYDTFDFYDVDCQKKILCELQQGNDTSAKLTREVSSLLVDLQVWGDRLPESNQYREALDIGQNPKENCTASFPKCRFSVKTFNSKFLDVWGNRV